jgi:hypothetical protein
MNAHSDFFRYLSNLQNGRAIQAAYRRYKTAECTFPYRLNGYLKSGLPIPCDLTKWHQYLMKAICAKNKKEIALYRMTSYEEFVGPLIPALRKMPIRYPAYLSASGCEERTYQFKPGSGTAIILEIVYPSRTGMALMEAKAGSEEDEFLLGCGTELSFVKKLPTNGEVERLRFEVSKNPHYVSGDTFDFDMQLKV